MIWLSDESRQSLRADKLPGIYGLRFIAALMVIVFHLRDVAQVPPPYAYDRYLACGVGLFFIISAFSLSYSTSKYLSQSDWIRTFALKRFFRIAPLFYVICLLEMYLQFTGPFHLSDVVLTVLFIFIFFPDLQGSLVWAGWTVGVEMIFYGFLPLIIGTVTSWRSAAVLLAICVLASTATAFAHIQSTVPPLFLFIIFPFHVQYFAVGVLVYFIHLKFMRTIFESSQTLIWIALTLAFIVCCWLMVVPTSPWTREQYYLASAIGLGVLVLRQSCRPSLLISNRFMIYWGERSYSMYLTHGLVLIYGKRLWEIVTVNLGPVLGYFVVAPLSVSFVLCVSWITYRFVERPGMLIGAWFWRKDTQSLQNVVAPLGEW